MSELQPLAPPALTNGPGMRGGLDFGFGDRFFVLLLAGLLWIGPLFWSRQFLYGLIAWDTLLLVAWFVDLYTLRNISKLVVERKFSAALCLEEAAQVRLRVTNM